MCDACQMVESHQLPFSISNFVASSPLELVFSDVWRPAVTSVCGSKYYVSFINSFSKFTWTYILKHKSDVEKICIQFHKYVERLLNQKKPFHSEVIGEENISVLTPTSSKLESITVCPIPRHTNRMMLQRGNTCTLYHRVLVTLH